MIWELKDWQEPCYNSSNGRCKALFKWNNTNKFIYEETTNIVSPILSFKRPHSRALYYSLLNIILTFMGLFHPISYYLIKNNFDFANTTIILIIQLSGSAFFRILFGIICDKIGCRLTYIFIILFGSLFGILNIIYELKIYVLCFFLGILSAGFTISEIWVITMFDKNILGLTTSLIGGIGNFGIGLIYYINYLIHTNKIDYIVVIYFPYILLIINTFLIYYFTDDTPYGNISKLKKLYLNNLKSENENQNDKIPKKKHNTYIFNS